MKNTLRLCIILALALCMSACGAKDPAVGSSSMPATPPAASQTPSAPEKEDDQPAQTNGVSDSTQAFIDAVNAENAEAKGICGNDLTWYYKENILVIKGTGKMNDYGNQNRNQTADAPWKEIEGNIHWVILENGITYIGKEAFRKMPQLSKAIIPDSVSEIADSAFADCKQLTSVQLGAGVTSLGAGVFSSCSQLQEIQLPDALTTIGEAAFSCTGIAKIAIPDGVTHLEVNTFRECSQLQEIRLPDTLTTLGDEVFARCSQLQEIQLPDTLTAIGHNAFFECGIKKITIPASVISLNGAHADAGVGAGAFHFCHTLQAIEVDENNSVYSSIDGVLFTKDQKVLIMYPQGKTDLTDYTIPAGVDTIVHDAFSQCRSLVKVTLPATLTSIPSHAFSSCSDLTEINIPAGITSIDDHAFSWCTALVKVTLPASLTSIGARAFENCQSLTEINLPAGITSIDDGAFQSCSSLVSIELPASVEELGSIVFDDCENLKAIYYSSSAHPGIIKTIQQQKDYPWVMK